MPSSTSAKPTVLVTVDTNILDDTKQQRLASALVGTAVDVAYVTVSEREFDRAIETKPAMQKVRESAVWGEAKWDEAVWFDGGPVAETFVLGESQLGRAALANDNSRFEQILKILSSGSFPQPGSRESLNVGQTNQLRDAIIFETHCRESRDIFITLDARGFINHGRRETFEKLGQTRIMTLDEFEDFVRA